MLKNRVQKALFVLLASGGLMLGAAGQAAAANQPSYATMGAERTTEIQIFSNWNKQETDYGNTTMNMIFVAGKKYISDKGTRVEVSVMKVDTESSGSKTALTAVEGKGRFPVDIDLGFDKAMEPEYFLEGQYGFTTTDSGGMSYTDMSFGVYAGVRLSILESSTLVPGAGFVIDTYDSARNQNDTETTILFTEYKFFPYDDGKLSLDANFERRSNENMTETDLRVGFTIRF